MKKGIFITLEGGEGTGKSTQVRLLSQALSAAGIDAVTTREPGGTPQAEKIRNLLVQRDGGDYDPMTEALLLFAGRREHLVNKIIPALKSGQWVISDRFADSTRAMQGAGMGLDRAKIENLYDTVVENNHPDLTIILDIDPETGLQRSNKRLQETANAAGATEDRYERMELPFHKRLRQGFLDIAQHDPMRCTVINAAQDPYTIHEQIVDVINKRYGLTLKAMSNG